jgi:hypothetical protein
VADVQRIIDEVRFRLQSTDSEPTEELNRLAAEYAELCHDVNLRLRRCGEFLKRGLRAEAIHLAEAEPSLLETFALVDFPERSEWDQFLTMFRLPRAEPLLADVAGELNEAYSLHAPLERLLSAHRLLALRRAPISQRLSIMRKLAEADPGFPFWDEDIRRFEKERVTEIGSEARAAFERGDGDALYALIGELTGPDWRQKPADSVVQAVRKLALESIADELASVFASRSIDRARVLRDQWNKLSAEMRTVPADKPAIRAAPALKWIAAEDSKSASSRRFHDRLLALEQKLADPQTLLADLDRARRDLLKSGRGIPEPLASQLYSRRVELARVKGTRRRQIIGGVTLAVVAVVTVVVLAVRSSGNTHAALQWADEADQMISRGNLVQARELLRKSEGAARTDRQQEVEARLADAEKREESRIGEFRKAIERARSAASREEADVSLQEADRLAVTLDERSTVENLTAEWNVKAQHLTEHEESRFQERLSEANDLLDRLEDLHEKESHGDSFFELLKSAEKKIADLRNSANHLKPNLSRHVAAAESRLARIRSAVAREKKGKAT